jgi:PAS domain S-box-containing protein
MVMNLNGSLRRRFSFTLIGVVTFISVIFSGAVIGYNYTQKEAELKRQLLQTLHLAETVLPEAVWQGNQRSINDILRVILASDAVIFARILVGDSIVISHVKPMHGEKKFSEFEESADFLISSADVFRQGILIGKLQVVMSRDEIYRETFSAVFSVVGLFTLLVVAILCTSMLIFRHYIFRPLAKLERSANLIAAGNLDIRIDIDTRDEIGSLASAFRLMANHLEESFANLENKVIDRTVDLSKAKIAAEKTSQHLLVAGAELQALLDNSPVGILFVDTEEVIKRVNSEMEKITGYRSSELVGQTAGVLLGTGRSDGAAGQKKLPRLTKSGLCERRASLMRKDGVEIACWLRGRSIPVSNELEGVIWSVEDISTRIDMEQELLKAKKMESIGVLAGGIAHDFNNILFAVIGNLSLAEKMTAETGGGREYIQAAQRASLRAKDLTAKLLTFASGGDPVKSTASLPDLVKDAIGFVLSGSNVKCSFHIPDDLWPVSMDKNQISQVIQDLVRNANQSMPEGGTIFISFTNKMVADDEIIGLYPGRYVRVGVTDRGRGIEGGNLDRVFDPYFSTKEKDSTKGSGLGLAIVHSIVTKHDGKISVDSSPGKGTTFTLYLPARLIESDSPSAGSAIVPTGKGVVLVLADDKKDWELVSEMLQHMGYRAQSVAAKEEAVHLYQEAFAAGVRFSAVIVALDIPGGRESQKMAASFLDIDPQAAVVAAIDPPPDNAESRNYLQEGFCALIIKPYKLLDLNRVMSSVDKDRRSGLGSPEIPSLKN